LYRFYENTALTALSALFKSKKHKMKFYKIENTGVPVLYNKIIGLSDNFPDRTYKTRGSNPSLWLLFQPIPIPPDVYDAFYDLFAEDRKLWVDGDVEIFNNKLFHDDFKQAKIIKTFEVNNTLFVVLDICEEMCFVLMVGNRPLSDRPDILGGKDGWLWTEDFYKKRVRKKEFQKIFGLTDVEADEFMKKYRS
jgi:hypothetical protein